MQVYYSVRPRTLGQALRSSGPAAAHKGAGSSSHRILTGITPAVDIVEDDHSYRLFVELPGVDKDHVHVHYKQGLLTIRGEKSPGPDNGGLKYHHRERLYGRFERSFRIPEEVAVDKIQADLRNGLMEVRLPKANTQRPKRVDVKIR